MKSALGRNVTAAVAAVVVAGSGLAVAATSTAHASSSKVKVPYEPDKHSVGSITFYNAHGKKITKGSIKGGPIAAYAVGSKLPSKGNRAVLVAAQPRAHHKPSGWNTDYLSSFTLFPVKSKAPGTIKTLSKKHPVVTGKKSDLSLGDFIKEFKSTSKKTKGLYQIRIVTAKGSSLSTSYDVADVLVKGSHWKQVYK